jgi:hypothetical protein
MGDECFEWSAWYNKMPGTDDPDLYVTGTCEVRSGSARVSLKLGDPGISPEPGVVVLQLTIEYPEVGTDDMAKREVSWSGDVGPDAKKVRIVGDAEAEIEVRDVG